MDLTLNVVYSIITFTSKELKEINTKRIISRVCLPEKVRAERYNVISVSHKRTKIILVYTYI